MLKKDYFKYRMYDAETGRFNGVDPLRGKYPHNSAFAFSENRVVDGVELEGLEFALIDMAKGLNDLSNYAKEQGQSGEQGSQWWQAAYNQFSLEGRANQVGNMVQGQLNKMTEDPLGFFAKVAMAPLASVEQTVELATGLVDLGAGVAKGEPQAVMGVVDLVGQMAVAKKVMPGGGKGGIVVDEKTISKAIQGSDLQTLQSGVSMPMVQRYVNMLEKGSIAPPIKVAGNVIVEGNHRYVAGRIFGKEPSQVPYNISPSKLIAQCLFET